MKLGENSRKIKYDGLYSVPQIVSKLFRRGGGFNQNSAVYHIGVALCLTPLIRFPREMVIILVRTKTLSCTLIRRYILSVEACHRNGSSRMLRLLVLEI